VSLVSIILKAFSCLGAPFLVNLWVHGQQNAARPLRRTVKSSIESRDICPRGQSKAFKRVWNPALITFAPFTIFTRFRNDSNIIHHTGTLWWASSGKGLRIRIPSHRKMWLENAFVYCRIKHDEFSPVMRRASVACCAAPAIQDSKWWHVRLSCPCWARKPCKLQHSREPRVKSVSTPPIPANSSRPGFNFPHPRGPAWWDGAPNTYVAHCQPGFDRQSRAG